MTQEHGDAKATGEALIGEVSTAFREYQRAVDALDELAADRMGINRTDARVLDLLEQHGRMTAGEIAAGARLTSGAVTGVLDRLERAGYARRTPDEHDRRRVLVEATPVVFERAREIYYGIRPKGEELMRGYSDDDLRLVLAFLRGVTEVTEHHVAELRDRHG